MTHLSSLISKKECKAVLKQIRNMIPKAHASTDDRSVTPTLVVVVILNSSEVGSNERKKKKKE